MPADLDALSKMKNIYIVPIEPIDQRYTKQWYENIPFVIAASGMHYGVEYSVVTIDGESVPDGTSSGAFLDFAATNIYKSSQVQRISEMFNKGEIKAGDKFLITDAWNFAVTAIRYMSDLLDIPVEIHGIWHAGAYDPTDILGMKMSKPWPAHQERAWFYACDYNYYATEFHRDMFLRNLKIEEEYYNRAIVSGQPHDMIIDDLIKRQQVEKQDHVMWPHRYNADKQPDIAEDLNNNFNMVITQKMKLDKESYYDTMAKSKVIFSCALHENLGISVMEGTLTGAIPIVPDRCSYAEMYLPEFKYPSEWTSSYENYQQYKSNLVEFIQDKIDNYSEYQTLLQKQQAILVERFLTADIMVSKLLDIQTENK